MRAAIVCESRAFAQTSDRAAACKIFARRSSPCLSRCAKRGDDKTSGARLSLSLFSAADICSENDGGRAKETNERERERATREKRTRTLVRLSRSLLWKTYYGHTLYTDRSQKHGFAKRTKERTTEGDLGQQQKSRILPSFSSFPIRSDRLRLPRRPSRGCRRRRRPSSTAFLRTYDERVRAREPHINEHGSR